MTTGERIKEIRNKLGISQVDFADKINVSKQTLYKYENNIITNIPSDKIEAAAQLANVSPAYLMGWTTEKNSPIATIHDQLNKQEKRINTFVQLFRLHGYTVETSENTVKISKDSNYCILTQKEFATLLNRCYKDFEYNISRYMDEYDSKMAVAAHERTDIEVTDEMKKHDDDIMDDDDF